MASRQDSNRAWKDLNAEIKNCHKCPGLNVPGVTENAPGFGSRRAAVMFVGQSLCTQCMAVQEPFYRESGLLLDAIFEKLGKTKRDFFTTNVVHCHPVHNRPSKLYEVKNCTPFLKREILLVQPKCIIPLGRDAIQRLIGTFDSLKSVLYQHHTCRLGQQNFVVRPAYHPAYFWRRGPNSPETRAYINGMARLIKPYLEEK